MISDTVILKVYYLKSPKLILAFKGIVISVSVLLLCFFKECRYSD